MLIFNGQNPSGNLHLIIGIIYDLKLLSGDAAAVSALFKVLPVRLFV